MALFMCNLVVGLLLKLALLVLLIGFCSPVLAIKIVLINPDKPGRPFWELTTEVAKAAADDLGVELHVLYGGGDRFANLRLIQDISLRKTNADYIIFLPRQGTAERSFETLEKAQLPFITLERSINIQEVAKLGKPGIRFKQWLGEVYFDDKQAGALLIKSLNIAAQKKGYLHRFIFALSGDNSAISVNRESGLQENLGENDQLNQIVHTLWDPVQVKNMVPIILKRYPETNIFWAASDEIALAIKQSLVENGISTDILIGGIGWLPQAIDAVRQDELVVSVGGHFMQGAWAVIKAFDHSKGLNPFSEKNNLPLQHNYINKDNVSKYKSLKQGKNWADIDFSQFSLFLNEELTQYDFNVEYN